MNSYFKLVLLTASILLAITFTISCSDGGDEGGGGGSGSFTESYTLRDVTDNSFTYFEVEEWYDCEEGGRLEKKTEEYKQDISYSIRNKVLAWEWEWRRDDDDSLNFAGTSNTLTGTWTRTKSKCKVDERYPDEMDCKSGFNYVKAEFTTSTLKITREYCPTDWMVDGYEDRKGWKTRVIDCNTYEMSKGADRVTIKETETETSFSAIVTYKGKTCIFSESDKTVSQREKACRDAWNEFQANGDGSIYKLRYYYEDLLYDDSDSWERFDKCLENNGFPEDIFGYDDDDDEPYYGTAFAKPLLKKQAKLR